MECYQEEQLLTSKHAGIARILEEFRSCWLSDGGGRSSDRSPEAFECDTGDDTEMADRSEDDTGEVSSCADGASVLTVEVWRKGARIPPHLNNRNLLLVTKGLLGEVRTEAHLSLQQESGGRMPGYCPTASPFR